jgi:hypothetical protein
MRKRFPFAVWFVLSAVASTAAIADEADGARHRAVSVGVLVGPSLPVPANISVLVKLFDLFAVGGSYGFLPHQLSQAALSALSLSDTSVEAWSRDVEVRVFPFRGAFFVGAAAGEQHVGVTVRDANGISGLDLKTRYVTPRLGWLGTWGPGFSVSFDMGAQLALKTDLAQTGAASQTDTLSTVSKYASVPQPSMNLKIGWMF